MAKKTNGRTVLGVEAPAQGERYDRNCPFHGELNVKDSTLEGVVVKKDVSGSATIEWERSRKVPKYERFEFRKSRIRVHNPASIDAKVGQKVLVARTRPISKTKHHVIIKVLADEKKAV